MSVFDEVCGHPSLCGADVAKCAACGASASWGDVASLYDEWCLAEEGLIETISGLCTCGTWDGYPALAALLKNPTLEAVKASMMANVEGFAMLLLWFADAHDYTDHGTSAIHSWLTNRGRALLKALQAEVTT